MENITSPARDNTNGMKCEKCQGIGIVDNLAYWNAKAKYGIDWAMFKHNPKINCKVCKGLGYIVSDMPDILHELKDIAITIPSSEQKRLRNCINIIENNL